MHELEIKKSAYKHGYTRDDIINCYRYPLAARMVETYPDKYLYIGFDMRGNPMEILVNHNGISVIFHAMKLRKEYESLLK